MRKKRILSLLLSVIMVLSVCASPFSSVFAAEQTTESQTVTEQSTDSSGAVTAGYDNPDDILENLFDAVVYGKPDAIFNGKLVTTFINMLFGDGKEGGVSTEDLLKKLNELGKKIDEYHSELVTKLDAISLRSELQAYDTAMTNLTAQMDTIHTAIKSRDENALITKVEDGSEDEKIAAINTLGRYYATIYRRCNQVKLLEKYNTAIAYITTESLPRRKSFVVAYELIKNNRDDADEVARIYKQYVYYQMAQLVRAYIDLTVYFKAEERYNKFDPSECPYTDSQAQLENAKNKLVNIINTEFADAVKRYDGTTKAGIQWTNKEGKQENKSYTTFAAAWKAVKDHLQNNEPVTFTLYQGWFASSTAGKGFVDKSPFTETDRKDCFTSKGEIIIPSGQLTINLNGHKICGEKCNLNIFQVSSGAKVTINGLSQEELKKLNDQRAKEGKATLVQGLYDARTAIKANTGQTEITLNNIDMKNLAGWGVHVDSTSSSNASKFTCNSCSIEGTKNCALCFGNQLECNINNCEFKNNLAERGAAIYINFGASKTGCTISNCKFENNEATKDGGAIYSGDPVEWNVENCTFTKNTARCGGGATYLLTKASGCTFTGNTAQRTEGGAMYDGRQIDNCTFTENTAGGEGGAVYVRSSATTRSGTTQGFSNSTFDNNQSKGAGGAIYVHSDGWNTKITNCQFNNNSSENNEGGAIYSAIDRLTIDNSTFTGNSCQTYGGAISTKTSGTLIINNSKLTKNLSRGGKGGALFLRGLNTEDHELHNVTITENKAKSQGGGVYCDKEWAATGDLLVEGKVIIENNTDLSGSKQSNVLLEQKGGTNNCVIKDYSGEGTRIGLDTDYSQKNYVVFYLRDETRFFGDNGRGLYKDGDKLYIRSR